MRAANERRSLLLRFLDVFLQENSIRWMLCIGLMILLGSSLMLVSSQWATYSIGWRLCVLLGYTGAVHGLGQLTYHSLGLRKTGTGLMALTVLLLPLTFHGLKWVQPSGELTVSSLLDHGVLWGSLAAAVALCVLAAKRIFAHFLRKTEPTFLAAYVVLCLAAAVVPLLPTSLAPLTAIVVWSVFAVGAASVNQHVFCMIEDHRLPRIFGFFPIVLLGSQFLAVFTLSLAEHIALPQIGLGVVLTAVPVLLAVDALARVFQRAHGKLARPYPWSIALPLASGTALMVTGLVLTATRFPQLQTFVPAAVLVAVMLGVIAKRTQQRGFVWAMLIATTLAYQFSPTFFRELALSVVRSGAASIGEQRLPVAFYGLTYLPLLAVLSVLSARGARRGEQLFAPVMQRFVGAMSVLLLLLAPTHPKAFFPVSMSLLANGLMQLRLFRSRSRLVLALAAYVLATLGLHAFVTEVLGVAVDASFTLLVGALASAVLALPGRKLDQLTARWLPEADRSAATPLCEATGLLGAIVLSFGWMYFSLQTITTPTVMAAGGLLAVLLLTQAQRAKDVVLTEYAVFFTVAVPTLLAISTGAGLTGIITACLLTLGALWLLVLLLARRSESQFVSTFGNAIMRQSAIAFGIVTTLFVWPRALWVLVTGSVEVDWMIPLLTFAWMLGSTLYHRSAIAAGATWISGLLLVSNAAVCGLPVSNFDVRSWVPVAWASLSIACLLIRRPRSESLAVLCETSHSAARFTLGLIAGSSLLYLSEPVRVAGVMASLGVIIDGMRQRNKLVRGLGWMALNWQVFAAVMLAYSPHLRWIIDVSRQDLEVAALVAAGTMSLQALLWRLAISTQPAQPVGSIETADKRPTDNGPIELADLVAAQRRLLFLVTGFSLSMHLISTTNALTVGAAALLIGTYCMLAVDCLLSARRRADAEQSGEAEGLVWLAQVIAVIAIGHLIHCGVIIVGSGLSLFMTLGYGLIAMGISRAARSSSSWSYLSRPLAVTSTVLPAVTVLLGVMRHASGSSSQWLGMNSLALLSAAGIYFWRGLEDRSKGFLVSSGVILNVACLLLWNELSWSDPQCFMIPLGLTLLGLVELLRDELPEASRNPLRYAGSLVILVSPTFHIVSGSWGHLFSLMLMSVLVALVGMGLRIRAMLYLGTAFLTADLLAMVIRGGVDNPSVLWLSGIGLGSAVITLAAYCERHREQLMQRLRLVAAELEAWQ